LGHLLKVYIAYNHGTVHNYSIQLSCLEQVYQSKLMLIYRQKLLLALLDAFGGKQTATDFQKYLFLYTTLHEKDKSYEFVPYKFGCYSFQASVDKRKLVEKGYLKSIEGWELEKEGISYSHTLKKMEPENIEHFVGKFKNLKGKRLIRHVYTKYPFYAINSQIAENILTAGEFDSVKNAKPKRRRTMTLATIGYEGGSVENYLNRLLNNDIRLLVDVRKNSISRKYGFSKNTLANLLSRVGIEYVHIPELGIESSDRKKLIEQSDYDRLFKAYERTVLKEQDAALNQLLDLYKSKKRIALTCFEKVHTQCHRSYVANKLLELDMDIKVVHL